MTMVCSLPVVYIVPSDAAVPFDCLLGRKFLYRQGVNTLAIPLKSDARKPETGQDPSELYVLAAHKNIFSIMLKLNPVMAKPQLWCLRRFL